MKSQSRMKIRYCRPRDIQYTARQVTKLEIVPERTRAFNTPSIRPETTIERAAARRLGGARSPTRGSINWGVTVVTAVMNEIAVKTPRLVVMQRPSLKVVSVDQPG